eukprot:scpid106012/ scgid30271/ 
MRDTGVLRSAFTTDQLLAAAASSAVVEATVARPEHHRHGKARAAESKSRQQTPKSALEDAMCLKIAKPGLSMAHPKLAYSLSGLQSVLAEERRCREHKAQGNTKQEDHYKAPGLDACSDHHSAD